MLTFCFVMLSLRLKFARLQYAHGGEEAKSCVYNKCGVLMGAASIRYSLYFSFSLLVAVGSVRSY